MVDVILVGNANTGKTTLFNSLTKSSEHVGNWHGVTVSEKSKVYSFENHEINLVDLPGIYSLSSLSFEEEVAVDYLDGHKNAKIINICDRDNIQRNLYLTLGLIERGFDVILAVNEINKKPINKIDYNKLSQVLHIPVIAINAEKKIGLLDLNKEIITEKRKVIKSNYFNEIDFSSLNSLLLNKNVNKDDIFYFSIKLYEKDEKINKKLCFSEKESNILKNILPNNSIEIIAKKRYDFIEKICSFCVTKSGEVYGKSKLDKIFLNKFLALPCFLVILLTIFYLTFFSVGKFLSGLFSMFIERCIGQPLINSLTSLSGSFWIIDLIETALIGGVGTVLSFLPQVALLFFFLSILEDSGYLSRLAFVFEDILSKVGLSGKSVYTLLMGFGCSTTAVMTARNMEDKNSKIKTVLLCPYMSCSAKFPIYAVIGGAFFGASNIFYILGLYLLGIVVAILLSLIYEKTILKSKNQSFILEFPPYRISNPKRLVKILWQNVKLFVVRVGSVIISMNIIIWLLSNFSFKFSYVANNEGVSMLESLGKVFAPIFSPLGFGNWAIVASLIAGLIAKEVVVSSIAMFNNIDSSSQKLIGESILEAGAVVFFASKASVVSFLIFCLLYFPCIATISMMRKEIGFKWTMFGILIQFLVAYITSFIVYNILFAIDIFGFLRVFLVVLFAFLLFFAVFIVTKVLKTKKICCKNGDCSNCNGCKK